MAENWPDSRQASAPKDAARATAITLAPTMDATAPRLKASSIGRPASRMDRRLTPSSTSTTPESTPGPIRNT
ncbi:MAG: hypothetical protein R2708_09175 [Vicinamibacterales bacterium]